MREVRGDAVHTASEAAGNRTRVGSGEAAARVRWLPGLAGLLHERDRLSAVSFRGAAGNRTRVGSGEAAARVRWLPGLAGLLHERDRLSAVSFRGAAGNRTRVPQCLDRSSTSVVRG